MATINTHAVLTNMEELLQVLKNFETTRLEGDSGTVELTGRILD
jgi:hypothetical protein